MEGSKLRVNPGGIHHSFLFNQRNGGRGQSHARMMFSGLHYLAIHLIDGD